jgi:hypothetical protein
MSVKPIHLIRHKDGRSLRKDEEQLNPKVKTVKFGLVSLEGEEEEEEEGPEIRWTAFSIQGTANPKLCVFCQFCFCLYGYVGLIILKLSIKIFPFFFYFHGSKSMSLYSTLSQAQQILP